MLKFLIYIYIYYNIKPWKKIRFSKVERWRWRLNIPAIEHDGDEWRKSLMHMWLIIGMKIKLFTSDWSPYACMHAKSKCFVFVMVYLITKKVWNCWDSLSFIHVQPTWQCLTNGTTTKTIWKSFNTPSDLSG